MSRSPKAVQVVELTQRIAYAERQFLIAQQYASYHQALATTGAAKLRDVAHGDGKPYTDEEKVKSALNTMLTHIQRMSEINDTISDLRTQLSILENVS